MKPSMRTRNLQRFALTAMSFVSWPGQVSSDRLNLQQPLAHSYHQPLIVSANPAFPFQDSASVKQNGLKDKYASIVVDTAGHILQAYNENKQIHPASLLKIATLYIVGEELEAGRLRLADTLTIHQKENRGQFELVTLGVSPKTRDFTVRKAIAAAGILSAKDACNILAYNISDSNQKFVARINDTFDKLDMQQSHAVNTHGGPVID